MGILHSEGLDSVDRLPGGVIAVEDKCPDCEGPCEVCRGTIQDPKLNLTHCKTCLGTGEVKNAAIQETLARPE